MPARDGFEFDHAPTPATNRAATAPCPTCDGHRLVQLPHETAEVYGRCPTCNPDPAAVREPVDEDAWWKQ